MIRFTSRLSTKCLAWALAITVPCAYIVWPTRAEASSLGSSTASAGNAFLPVQQAIHAFQPDLFTGRATTAIPIIIPPGRKGMQPALALSYASSNRNSWLGVGWSLDLGAIERSTKDGVPTYGASDTFVLTFQGVQSDLVAIAPGSYRAKDEGMFLNVTFDGTSWLVRDKAGTQYLFGTSAESRVQGQGGTFRWQLNRVVDTNGNYLDITYVSDGGMLYPAEIHYTGHAPTNAPPPHRVVFTLESRPDSETHVRSGAPLTIAKRLKDIAAYANGADLARRYVLAYTTSTVTGRSLLTGVTQIGSDGATALPPQTLTYQADAASYVQASSVAAQGQPHWNLRTAAADLGGSNFGVLHPYAGLPWSAPILNQSGSGSSNGGNVRWTIGSDGALQLRGNTDHHVHAWTYVYVSVAKSLSLSLNKIDCDSNASLWVEDAGGIRRVDPGSFSVSAGWSLMHVTDYNQNDCFSSQLSGVRPQVDDMNATLSSAPHIVADVNGDGYADLLTFDANATPTEWRVELGTGVGFLAAKVWLTGFGAQNDTPLVGDFDADGLTDLAILRPDGTWRFARALGTKVSGTRFQADAWPAIPWDANRKPFLGDVNGDGLTDIGEWDSATGAWNVRLSTGAGFGAAQTWLTGFGASTDEPLVGDWNGDGLTDVGRRNKSSGDVFVARSTGTQFEPLTGAWITGFGPGRSATSADVNGDGLTDLAYYDETVGKVWTALSERDRFGASRLLYSGFTLRGNDVVLQVGDVNGDGQSDLGVFNQVSGAAELAFSTFRAPDLLAGLANGVGGSTAITYRPSTAFNAGLDYIETTAPLYVYPGPLVNRINFYGDSAGSFVDYQNNAITLHYVGSPSAPKSYASVGIDLNQVVDVSQSHHVVISVRGAKGGEKLFVHLRDENWKTYDLVQMRTPTIPATGLTTATQDITVNLSELLVENAMDLSRVVHVAVEAGGKAWNNEPNNPPDTTIVITGIRFEPVPPHDSAALPFVTPVVTQTDLADGLGHTYTTRYEYATGIYDGATREFRGFNRARTIDAELHYADAWFHQDDKRKGRMYMVEQRDVDRRVYARTWNRWETRTVASGVTFAFLASTDQWTFDGDDTGRLAQTDFTYDDYGNVTDTFFWGEVNPAQRNTHSGDEKIVRTSFVYNTAAWIMGLPSDQRTYATDWTLMAQRRFYYDGATSTATTPTLGNLTKEEGWLVADPQTPNPERWLPTTMTYDPYGNVKTVIDALNHTTTNTYDPALQTYLVQVANALNHTRTLVYDPRLGVTTSSTDPNGKTTRTIYDALGRVTKVIGPLDTDALPTMNYEYNLSTVPSRTISHARILSGAPATVDVYAFADGLGRTLQTRTPAEDPAQQVVTGDSIFDARGLVSQAYLPYLATTATSYQPPPSSALTVSYTYDPVGRLTRVTDPNQSSSTTTYDDWRVTTTDAAGRRQRSSHDAYGQLATVEEFNGADTYTTTYGYNATGGLTQVTDHAGHVTTIAYDSLGRKRTMNDPDMGAWSYVYDDVDNLATQTDARSVVTAFAYDLLNRLTQKSFTSPPNAGVPPATPVTYRYDEAGHGVSIGRLTTINDSAGTAAFTYDTLGRLTTEARTLGAKQFTMQRAYDLLGRLTSLTYPDGLALTYAYNLQGGLERITAAGAQVPLATIVNDMDYNAAGQLTKIIYGNGVVSDYAYDPQTLRLSTLRTINAQQAVLQNFAYQFNAVGDVTSITDTVHRGTQSFLYDDLGRLTQATGASYGVLNHSYDPLGNMTGKGPMTMTYGLADGTKPHAVTSATSAGLSTTLTYDANGNMRSRNDSAEALRATNYTFDAENRLTQVDRPPTTSVTVHLEPGWNFFALPVLPANAAVTAVLPTFGTDIEPIARVATPRAPTSAPTFEHFVGETLFDDFTTLDYARGYELYCTNPAGRDVTIAGSLPLGSRAQALEAGWRLLGAPGDQPRTVAGLLNGLVPGVDVGRVLRYDAKTQQFVALSQTDLVRPGEAVDVEVLRAVTWTPPTTAQGTTRFVYDGDGGRVYQIAPAGLTTYVGELVEVAPDGATTQHVFAGALRVASITRPATAPATPTVVFSHGDHLGSSHVVTNASGGLVSVTEYTPYGELAPNSALPASSFGFTGQRFDTSTGLYFYHARYYDPTLGRFLSPDSIVQAPSDPQTLNRYSYCRNNPVRYTDPSGHFIQFLIGLLIAIVISVAVEATIHFLHIEGGWAKALRAVGAAASAGVGGAVGGLTGHVLANAMVAAAATSLALDTGTGREVIAGFARGLQELGVGRKAAAIIASTITSAVTASVIFVGLTTINPNPVPSSQTGDLQSNGDGIGKGGRRVQDIQERGSPGSRVGHVGGGTIASAPAFGDVKQPTRFTQFFERIGRALDIRHTAFQGPSGQDTATRAFPFMCPGSGTCQQQTFGGLVNEGVRGIEAFQVMSKEGGWTFFFTSAVYGVHGSLGLQGLTSGATRASVDEH